MNFEQPEPSDETYDFSGNDSDMQQQNPDFQSPEVTPIKPPDPPPPQFFHPVMCFGMGRLLVMFPRHPDAETLAAAAVEVDVPDDQPPPPESPPPEEGKNATLH